jgi:hypothetical protein
VNAIVAQLRNYPFPVNAEVEVKTIKATNIIQLKSVFLKDFQNIEIEIQL